MNDIYNQSHCADLTVKHALDNIQKKEKEDAQKQRAKDLLGCIIRICSLAGYDVVSDFSIRSRRTGVTYSSKRRLDRK